MSTGGQSLGKDVSVVIVTASGTLNIPAAAITKFDSKPVTGDEKRIGLDGQVRNNVTHEGWNGSFEVDRFNSVLDDFWAAAEAAYYAGTALPWGTIQETITNPDLSVSQYTYTQVVLKLTDIGSREGNKTIKQKLDFVASRRIAS
ncbi:hypothetical protein GJ699_02595 [Duganella sp. FT80W]|uniref:Phage tail protein n=1 Tax=Duganella guangzhouensis TaxID=2666084 RepID=A0A6I2KUU5_9BURK|nr:hypothetical protein [Duganella guangzhouensis]MRW88867.1 hypothetical protein [Duganella guangzhouensis]